MMLDIRNMAIELPLKNIGHDGDRTLTIYGQDGNELVVKMESEAEARAICLGYAMPNLLADLDPRLAEMEAAGEGYEYLGFWIKRHNDEWSWQSINDADAYGWCATIPDCLDEIDANNASRAIAAE